jgi:anaerobic magnesium-protoporphyrin IX monomethyl ester cyclase
MKLLYTHSYFLNFDTKQLAIAMPYPPLATLYAAAYLRENNHQVFLHDIQFAHSALEIETSIKLLQPEVLIIYDDGFNYLTKMCLTNMRMGAYEMQKIAKKYNCKVIISSSDSTDHFEDYIDNGADFIIIGEGEQTLLELITELDKKTNISDYSKISGLIYKEKEKFIKTQKRIVLKDLDTLPLPAWDLLDIKPYQKMWLANHGYFSINMATTRGCPFKCNWCAKPIYGNRYNSHSPEKIVSNIKYLQNEFGFSHIWFADDIFGLKPNWIKQFNELIQKNKLQIKYKIQSRADLLLEEDNIKDLAESGCETVWMGAESGSQKILDAMEKGTKIEQIYKATQLLKANGIQPAFFLQFGYLDEKMEDINQTIKMVNELLPYDIGISVSYPLPGTTFYEKVKLELIHKSNWTDSDDLDLMFKNTYSPNFYKHLCKYVHKSYRTNQAISIFKNFKSANNNNISIKRVLSLPFYYLSSLKEKYILNAMESDAKAII